MQAEKQILVTIVFFFRYKREICTEHIPKSDLRSGATSDLNFGDIYRCQLPVYSMLAVFLPLVENAETIS